MLTRLLAISQDDLCKVHHHVAVATVTKAVKASWPNILVPHLQMGLRCIVLGTQFHHSKHKLHVHMIALILVWVIRLHVWAKGEKEKKKKERKERVGWEWSGVFDVAEVKESSDNSSNCSENHFHRISPIIIHTFAEWATGDISAVSALIAQSFLPRDNLSVLNPPSQLSHQLPHCHFSSVSRTWTGFFLVWI